MLVPFRAGCHRQLAWPSRVQKKICGSNPCLVSGTPGLYWNMPTKKGPMSFVTSDLFERGVGKTDVTGAANNEVANLMIAHQIGCRIDYVPNCRTIKVTSIFLFSYSSMPGKTWCRSAVWGVRRRYCINGSQLFSKIWKAGKYWPNNNDHICSSCFASKGDQWQKRVETDLIRR